MREFGDSARAAPLEQRTCHARTHSRIRGDAKTLFHPLWMCRISDLRSGLVVRASRSRSGSCALCCSGSTALCICTLTSILHVASMQNTAHADTSRIVLEEQRDQTGAPRTGVGLQPPASVENPDGADGADATLYRGHCGRVQTTFGRGRPGVRPVRSGRGGLVAPIAARQA